MWFPSTEKIKPGRTQQIVLGIQTKPYKGWNFSIEAYYKDMQNLYEYRDDELFTLGAPLDDQFTSGFGWAYGVEFFLEKKIGRFTGWIGYTWSKTLRKFDDLNNGKAFYNRFDRRNDLSIATIFDLTDSWELGMTWVYNTGQAYTFPDGVYTFDSGDNRFLNEKFHYTERNGYRLPSYHRMDLNLSHKGTFLGLNSRFHINIYNVYNRRNPFGLFVDYDYSSVDFSETKVLRQFTLFPIIPTIGYSLEF